MKKFEKKNNIIYTVSSHDSKGVRHVYTSDSLVDLTKRMYEIYFEEKYGEDGFRYSFYVDSYPASEGDHKGTMSKSENRNP
jgi:hypothetical protein